MNLIIDQGNSSAKIAIFNADKEVFALECPTDLVGTLGNILNTYGITQAIYSSVSTENKETNIFLSQHIQKVIFLGKTTPIPIQIAYKTPETLGNDRLAGVIGANMLRPNENCLVIDAGTAITYDFIDAKGVYWGGNIAPGLKMRFDALHNYTARLPLVAEKGDLPNIGYSTETAIRSGVVMGLVYEIEGYIAYLKQKHGSLFVFLTGGDTFFLAEKLKNSIFADTKLLIKGLNRILNYNANL